MAGNDKAYTIKKGNDRYLWPGVEHSRCEDYYFPEVKFKLFIVCITRRTVRTIRKVMGGGGGGVGEKTKKKFMQGKMPRKKFLQRRR